jgi:hypothetical protein
MGMTVAFRGGRVRLRPRWGAGGVAASQGRDHGAVRELRHALL